MSKKPRKRLVGWDHYVMTVLDKGMGYSAAAITLFGGLTFLILSAICFWFAVHKEEAGWGIGAVLSLLGVASLSCGKSMLKNAKKVERVELITPQNAKRLPEVETLVRSSDLPLAHQQAELLRAAPQGSATALEELLRATGQNAD